MPLPRAICISHHSTGKKVTVTVTSEAEMLGQMIVQPSPVISDILAEEAAFIAASAAVIAGQTCLAPEIILEFPLAETMVSNFTALTQLLYDSHAYAQRKALPEVHISAEATTIPAKIPIPEPTRTCLLLWSGGKDSVASLLVLRANGFNVVGIHAPANFSVQDPELAASKTLAEQYGMKLYLMDLEWDILRSLTKQYSTSFDIFPLKNAVPHGRDLMLAAAAAVIARREQISYICAGFTKEGLREHYAYEGRMIGHDIQSIEACTYMNALLESAMGVRFFSPLAALSEFVIFRHLTRHEAGAWKHIVSCFWGNWCGECTKCLRYALMQQVLGTSLIVFRKNPISYDNPAFRKLLDTIDSNSVALWEDQIYCVATLYEAHFFDEMPEVLARLHPKKAFLHKARPELLASLETLINTELDPPGFRYIFT